MIPFIDIGIGLLNMVLGSLFDPDSDTPPEPSEVISPPVPARLVFPLSPPYYQVPGFAQRFKLANGLVVTVDVSPEKFPEVYAFIKNGCRHARDAVSDDTTIDIMSETQDFSVDVMNKVLKGEITVTINPTYPPA